MIRPRAALGALLLASLPATALHAQSQEELLFPASESSDGAVPSVQDIESLIDLPPQVRLGRESDENLEQPSNLFEDPAVRARILGNDPEIIYIPEGIDPMIIPWVRNEVVAREMMEDASRLFEQATLERNATIARQALQVLESIYTLYGETPQAKDAERTMTTVRAFVAEVEAPPPPPPNGGTTIAPPEQPQEPVRVVELPTWVEENTRGALYNSDAPETSIVLVGDFILRKDDPVPAYPAVTVAEISDSRVIYRFSGRDFSVPIVTE